MSYVLYMYCALQGVGVLPGTEERSCTCCRGIKTGFEVAHEFLCGRQRGSYIVRSYEECECIPCGKLLAELMNIFYT